MSCKLRELRLRVANDSWVVQVDPRFDWESAVYISVCLLQ